ncbi:hypothetical protein Tco_0620143 [Tanacetum coccineum]
MDDLNITMKEYIRLEEEKSQKHGKVFNWETAMHGRIWYDEDIHDLKSIKNEFPAIIFNDSLTSGETLSCEPTGLTVIALVLPIIDMAKLVRLQLCIKLDDTWAWVPAGLARQEGGARGVAEEAPVAPGGGDEDEEMPQAGPPPPRTQGERISRLEEEVHGVREALQGQREVLDSMAHDFSRFSTWTVTRLVWMMDRVGVPYTRYLESPIEYKRRTKYRTGKSNTSIAP